MSLVLGPIHYLMHQKMLYQEKLTQALLKDTPALAQSITAKQSPVEEGDLVNLIDQTNIHGWLSSRIDMAESRLAAAYQSVPNADEIIYQMGQLAGENADFTSYQTLFNSLNPFLLDGMPCDRGLSANIPEDEDALYLIQNENVHPCFELENPLDISPEESLSKTCAGGHDHDHHETFDIHHFLAPAASQSQPSSFAVFRMAFITGFLSKSPYQALLINEKDIQITPRSN